MTKHPSILWEKAPFVPATTGNLRAMKVWETVLMHEGKQMARNSGARIHGFASRIGYRVRTKTVWCFAEEYKSNPIRLVWVTRLPSTVVAKKRKVKK